MMIVLVFFGAAIAEGSVFQAVTWQIVFVTAVVILVIRPVCGWLGLVGHRARFSEKAVIAFFGIRGLGSFYYIAYALGQAEFAGSATLWATVCLVVLTSIVMHGVVVTPVMQKLDDGRSKQPRAQELPPL